MHEILWSDENEHDAFDRRAERTGRPAAPQQPWLPILRVAAAGFCGGLRGDGPPVCPLSPAEHDARSEGAAGPGRRR
ncbi:MAG: hypothetical protein J2P46_18980, partial [Zavarzinella sp.]|nr:hypothetical protein [Zavarzinella sp.]